MGMALICFNFQDWRITYCTYLSELGKGNIVWLQVD
jgi:hypothetical protein